MPVSDSLRAQVFQQDGWRCAYCKIDGWELQVDHVIPVSLRRRTATLAASNTLNDISNLVAACAHCNRHKGDHITGESLLFGTTVPLFHPRQMQWHEHFAWSSDYLRVFPLTATGDATIVRLRMNARVLQRQRALLRRLDELGRHTWP